MFDFAKPFILIALFFLFFAVFSAVLPGTEKKDSNDLTTTVTQGYVINTRYLMGYTITRLSNIPTISSTTKP